MTLPESDWRLFKSIHRAALDRYCLSVLEECVEVVRGKGSSLDRYLRLYRLLQERDRSIATAFDDIRRSTAVERLAAMIALKVVNDEELDQFSAGTRESAKIRAGHGFR